MDRTSSSATPSTCTATITGRYGAGRLPTSTFWLNGLRLHVYAPCDLDGLINSGDLGENSVTGYRGREAMTPSPP